jgi:mannose-6-phosphate isomerase-like protein (cupin superfamily)
VSFHRQIHVRSDQTPTAPGVIELAVPAGWDGPPLHHHAFDETFYVLEGELTFQLGDVLVARGPGSCVFAPGGSVHTLANLAETPARYLLVCTPGGFERRFDDEPRDVPPTTMVGPTIHQRLAAERP